MMEGLTIKQESSENPWDVTTITDFLYYCCPECDTKTKTSEIFIDHAVNAHNMAKESLIQLIEDCIPEPLGETFNDVEDHDETFEPIEELVEPVLDITDQESIKQEEESHRKRSEYSLKKL